MQTTILQEIEKRHAKRCEITSRSRKLTPPILTDSEHVKEHGKDIKEMQTEYLNACWLVEYDMRLLLHVLRQFVSDAVLAEAFEYAKKDVKFDDWLRERLEEIARIETEKAEKSEKKDGQPKDLPGQQKLKVKDDGSTAEAASECTTSKFVPEDETEPTPAA